MKKDFCKDCYSGTVGKIQDCNLRTLCFGYLNLVYAARTETMHRILRQPESTPVPLITSSPSGEILCCDINNTVIMRL